MCSEYRSKWSFLTENYSCTIQVIRETWFSATEKSPLEPKTTTSISLHFYLYAVILHYVAN
jgi:hypothetical protein